MPVDYTQWPTSMWEIIIDGPARLGRRNDAGTLAASAEVSSMRRIGWTCSNHVSRCALQIIALCAVAGCSSVSDVGDTIAKALDRPTYASVGLANDEKLKAYEDKLWVKYRELEAAVNGMLAKDGHADALRFCDMALDSLKTHYEVCGKDCATLASKGFEYKGYWPEHDRYVRVFSDLRIQALVQLNRLDEAYADLAALPSLTPRQVTLLGMLTFQVGKYSTAVQALDWLQDYSLRTDAKRRDEVAKMAATLLRKLAPDLKTVSDRIPRDGSVPMRHCLQATLDEMNGNPASGLREMQSCVQGLSSSSGVKAAVNAFVADSGRRAVPALQDPMEMARLGLERAHRGRAMFLLMFDRFDDAITDLTRPGVQHYVLFNESSNARDVDPIALYYLANARAGKGDLWTARQLLLNMDGSVVHVQWGVSDGSQLATARWAALADVSLRMEPKDGVQPGDAVKFAGQALELQPNDPIALEVAVRAYRAAGDVKRAEACLAELQKVDPASAAKLRKSTR